MLTATSGTCATIITLPLVGTSAATCRECAERLLKQVSSLIGVTQVRVDSGSATMAIHLDTRISSEDAVRTQAQSIGAQIDRSFGHRVYRIEGLDCAHCAEGMEIAVRKIAGVSAAQVQFSAAKLLVEFEAGQQKHSTTLVEKRVQALGFGLHDAEAKNNEATAEAASASTNPGWLASRPAQVVICGVFLALGMAVSYFLHNVLWERLLFGGAVVAGGYRLAAAGLQALQARVLGTNLLMVLAATGAIILGHWAEAAMVVFLYTLGEVMESAAMQRARTSLRSLMESTPEFAVVQRENALHPITLPAGDVCVGDVLVVRPGTKVATDGIVVSGTSSLAEAAITGESMPRVKRRGDIVYGGSVNGNGSLLVRVTTVVDDSTVARVQRLVEEAQAQKAPLQTQVERFGRIYTPLVLIAAVVLAVGGPLLSPGTNWTYRALTLLVVSCPCALIIATPVAFVCGIARAAREGVLVKGGAHLEALARVRAVAMDKTGTLTAGTIAVTDTIVHGAGWTTPRVLALAASVERESEHPVAAAISAEAMRHDLPLEPMRDGKVVPGRGMQATQVASCETVRIGNVAFLREAGISFPARLAERVASAESDGKTIVVVAYGAEAVGLLVLEDTLRPEAVDAVHTLQKQLDLQTVMLTGDNRGAATCVAKQVGITQVQAALLPQDKLAAIRAWEDKGSAVAFVGDGINDAPALAAAQVGIGMGNGTAAALETADIVLMRSDLSLLPFAVRLARATHTVVRLNLALSTAAVATLVIGSLMGGISLPVGVLAHEASALLVTVNALCLLTPRIGRDGKFLRKAERENSNTDVSASQRQTGLSSPA